MWIKIEGAFEGSKEDFSKEYFDLSGYTDYKALEVLKKWCFATNVNLEVDMVKK